MEMALTLRNFSQRQPPTFALCSLLTLTVLSGLLIGERAYGEERPQEFPDRLKLYGGYQKLFGIDGKFRLDGTKTGLGSTLDWEDGLGGDDDDDMLRAGLEFRFNENHAIGFSWYDINLHGSRTVDEDLQIDDKIFTVGGGIRSKVDLTVYRFYYNWSFYHSDKTELFLSPGLYIGDFEAKFKGNLVFDPDDFNPITGEDKVKEKIQAPLPTLGLGVEYKIFPRLKATLRTDFFYVNVDDIEGTLAEFYFGLEYRILKHFAVGAAFDRMMVDIDYKNGKPKGWELDMSWNGGLFYGALYF